MKLHTTTDLLGGKVEALFSDEFAAPRYRFQLTHRWGKAPPLYVCMLNPSTADHKSNDPTVAGLIKRASQWGYGGLTIVNLFAMRSPDPMDLKKPLAKPTGDPDNETVVKLAIHHALDDGSPFICGWGKHGSYWSRDEWFCRIAKTAGINLFAFQVNDDGSPKHPLYVRHDLRPVIWRRA